ncbi:MAG: P-II family nitrogen regulator [Acidobacteriota bacterium]
MKEINAVIQPYMLDNVLLALDAIADLPGLTVSQVLGWGRERGATAQESVREAGHSFARKTKLEIVVADELAPRVVQAIVETARSGRPGDGKIFVSDVEQVVRIRTGERDEEAL